MALPAVYGSNPICIHEFCQKLLTLVQSLETMGKLKTIEGYVRNTLDKLPQIQSHHVRLNGQWQQWDFSKIIDAQRPRVKRNPVTVTGTGKENRPIRRDKDFNTHQQNATYWKYVFCDRICILKDPVKRRQIVRSKKMYLNFLKYSHCAADY